MKWYSEDLKVVSQLCIYFWYMYAYVCYPNSQFSYGYRWSMWVRGVTDIRWRCPTRRVRRFPHTMRWLDRGKASSDISQITLNHCSVRWWKRKINKPMLWKKPWGKYSTSFQKSKWIKMNSEATKSYSLHAQRIKYFFGGDKCRYSVFGN